MYPFCCHKFQKIENYFIFEKIGYRTTIEKEFKYFKVHPQNVRFQNLRFQNVRNVRFTKRQVYKTSGLQNVRFTKRQVFKTKLLLSSQKYGFGIRDPGSKIFYLGSRGQKSNRSRIRIRNTGLSWKVKIRETYIQKIYKIKNADKIFCEQRRGMLRVCKLKFLCGSIFVREKMIHANVVKYT